MSNSNQILFKAYKATLTNISQKLANTPLSLTSSWLYHAFQYLVHYDFFTNNSNHEEIHRLFQLIVDSELNDHIDGGFYTLEKHSSDITLATNKTLFNNALLINVFTNFSGHYFDGFFSVPTINSCQWIVNHLQSSSGHFYHSMEIENSLNNYYFLDSDYLKQHLDFDGFKAFNSAYIITSQNLLKRVRHYQQISDNTDMHIKQVPLAVESARMQLSLVRQKNSAPEINNSFDVNDNCKMICSLFNAAHQFNRDDFAETALLAIEDLSNNLSERNNVALIHPLLIRLRYQWSDSAYQWLIEIITPLLNDPNSAAVLMAENHIECIIEDLLSLHLLSSNKGLLNVATEIVAESSKLLSNKSEIQPKELLSLLKYQSNQFFIVIRGTAYETTYWSQQLTTGFNPSIHVYAIPNNEKDPSCGNFPESINTTATVYPLNSHQQAEIKTYISVDQLLSDLS